MFKNRGKSYIINFSDFVSLQRNLLPNRVIIFTKNVVKGQVKTRLAATVGPDKALEIYTFLLTSALKCLSDVGPGVERFIYFSDYASVSDMVPTNFQSRVQRGSDLGERMSKAIGEAFSEGSKYVCLVGGDIYGLTSQIMNEAFAALATHELVLGPARDGGYYLVGFSRSASKKFSKLFSNIPWGTSDVLERTQRRADTLGLRYFMLPVLTDIDEISDLPAELLSKFHI